MDIEFEMKPIENSLIMVAGIGGGGGNAVKHMYNTDVEDVTFMVVNTDSQALARSPIELQIQLGDGLGAGNNPDKARIAAEQSREKIESVLKENETKMLFITAGMGGGTGTGASPVVAKIAKDLGILTVGIVSIPYKGEGPKRVKQAVEGIEALLPNVDSLIVINNEHIAQIYGKLGIKEAHSKADDILTMAAKSISDIVTKPMDVNVDFADVTTIMKEEIENSSTGKIALMGSATGVIVEGDNSALKIAEAAVNSPLLHHNDIRGAKKVLFSITWGNTEVAYDEALMVMDFIQQRSGLQSDSENQTDVIWGAGHDAQLGDNVRITVVATGYDTQHIPVIREYYSPVLTPQSSRETVPSTPVREVISIDDNDGVVTPRSVANPTIDDEFGVVNHGEGSAHRRVSTTMTSGGQGATISPTRIEVSASGRRAQTEGVVGGGGGAHSSAGADSNPVIDGGSPLVQDDVENLSQPAYLRRGVNLVSETRESGATREPLDGGGKRSDRSATEEGSYSLFDGAEHPNN